MDGAIHRAAGPGLLAENRTLGGCPTGEARASGGYRLPAHCMYSAPRCSATALCLSPDVISTVGPVGENPDQLASAYTTSLQQLIQLKQRTIAFPCISTGVYGYPNAAACSVALCSVRRFLEQHHQVGSALWSWSVLQSSVFQSVDRVIFCLFLPVDIKLYQERMPVVFPTLLDKKVGQEGKTGQELKEEGKTGQELKEEDKGKQEQEEADETIQKEETDETIQRQKGAKGETEQEEKEDIAEQTGVSQETERKGKEEHQEQ